MGLSDSWDDVRAEFALSDDYIHLAISQLLASHPRMVREEIDRWKSKDAMKKLREWRIVATVAPYSTAYLRFTPGIINTPAEVDTGLDPIRRLA
jgi:hypothetical protein